MPEGPEIKLNSIFLQKFILGDTIKNIIAFSKIKVNIPKPSKIININSKGKILYIQTNDYFIHIHFGISGWLFLNDEPKYTKYIIQTNNNTIYIDSMRKFTKLNIYNQIIHTKQINKLGVDILSKEFTFNYIKEQLNNSNTMIAPFLLKQNIFAGLGNYIKNEALYIANIKPKEKTSTINDSQIKKLHKAIRYVSFSVLFELLTNYQLLSYAKINYKNKISIPYNFKIYNKTKTSKNEKVIKQKIGGRWSYYTN
jgi:formamidopyrimidine-DNA glycosylase